MRHLVLVMLLLAAVPAAATEANAPTFTLHLDRMFEAPEQALTFDAQDVLRITPQEFRLVLWDAPMGRLHYELSRQRAMFGREGLVHGHRAIGIGLEGAALGAGSSQTGLNGLLSGRTQWGEMSAGERVTAGVQLGISIGILAAIFNGLD
jgi:hypothetical protein